MWMPLKREKSSTTAAPVSVKPDCFVIIPSSTAHHSSVNILCDGNMDTIILIEDRWQTQAQIGDRIVNTGGDSEKPGGWEVDD